MCRVTKEDWMFLIDLDDPEYEKKFNSLLEIYLKRAEEKMLKMPLSEREEKREQLNTFKYYFSYENWIAVLPTKIRIVLTKDRLREQRRERCHLFCDMLGIVGIIDDLPKLFEGVYKPRELSGILVNCFTKLSTLHLERHKNHGINKITSKVTDLFVPKVEYRYVKYLDKDRIEELKKEFQEQG